MDEKRVGEAIELMKNQIDTIQRIPEFLRLKVKTDELIEKRQTVIEALEKQISKKPICVPKLYSEELGFNDEIHCPSCRRYVGFFMEGMSEPGQMEYCCECGQRIAKDWSESA